MRAVPHSLRPEAPGRHTSKEAPRDERVGTQGRRPALRRCGDFAAASPAAVQPQQDGLVNVNVGDVTILEDVRVALAAQVCGVSVGPVAVLGRAVDRDGETRTVCERDQGPVKISQND